jgi:hypothetical protein
MRRSTAFDPEKRMKNGQRSNRSRPGVVCFTFERSRPDQRSYCVQPILHFFSNHENLDCKAKLSITTHANAEGTMSDTPPDRLCNNPKSPFFNEELLERGVGIRFNGAERNNVEEYCVSEGWVRVVAGKSVDRHGNPMTVKLKGTVEPYFRTAPTS